MMTGGRDIARDPCEGFGRCKQARPGKPTECRKQSARLTRLEARMARIDVIQAVRQTPERLAASSWRARSLSPYPA